MVNAGSASTEGSPKNVRGPAAIEFAALARDRRRAGRPITIADAQIAAVARCHGAALATRNVSDFEGCGVDIINPWAGPIA